jgi:hypothetical protein
VQQVLAWLETESIGMNIMDHAGWIIAGSLICLLLGAIIQKFVLSSNCETCGMSGLKEEIERLKQELIDELKKHQATVTGLCNLVRALAEKVGITVKEQLELERLEKG